MQQVTLTQEMLWSDHLAEIADTLDDFIGLSKEERRRIKNLTRSNINAVIHLDGGHLTKPYQYKIIIQGNGLVFMHYLVSLTAEQKQNFLAAQAQVKEFQQEYLAKVPAIGSRLDV